VPALPLSLGTSLSSDKEEGDVDPKIAAQGSGDVTKSGDLDPKNLEPQGQEGPIPEVAQGEVAKSLECRLTSKDSDPVGVMFYVKLRPRLNSGLSVTEEGLVLDKASEPEVGITSPVVPKLDSQCLVGQRGREMDVGSNVTDMEGLAKGLEDN